MTSTIRLNRSTADLSKAKRAEREDQDMMDADCLVELDTTELTFVAGAGGRPKIEF